MAETGMVRNDPKSRPNVSAAIWRWPKNRDYSHALAKAIGQSAFGAGMVAEIEMAVRDARVGNPERWFRSWNALGERTETIAHNAEQEGDLVSARDAYLRASTYYRLADRYLYPDDRRRLEMNNPFSRSVASFERAGKYLNHPMEKVQIALDGASLPAYLFLPRKNGRSPALIFLNDFETTKEEQYFALAKAAAKRGIATLCVDGPGQGESLRVRGLKMSFASETFVPQLVTYLQQRSEIDMGKIGLVGWGLGGYMAARAAAHENRISFCVVWSALVDLESVFDTLSRVLSRETLVNLLFAMGFSDMRESREKLKGMRLAADTIERIACPVYILHGREDPFLGVSQAEALFEMVKARKDLTVVEPEWGVGGVLHNQVDNLVVAHYAIFPKVIAEFGMGAVGERMAA